MKLITLAKEIVTKVKENHNNFMRNISETLDVVKQKISLLVLACSAGYWRVVKKHDFVCVRELTSNGASLIFSVNHREIN